MGRLLVNTTNGVSTTVGGGLRILFPTEILDVSWISKKQAAVLLEDALLRGSAAGLLAAEENVAYPTVGPDGSPAYMILENGAFTGVWYTGSNEVVLALTEAAYGRNPK